MRRVVALLLLAAAPLAAVGCGGSTDESAPAAGQVSELRSVDQFAAAFDADRGRPRLVLLLSPT